MIEEVAAARDELAHAVAIETRRAWILKVALTVAAVSVSLVVLIALVTTRMASNEKSTVIADQTIVIADQRRTIDEIKSELTRFAASDSCLNAYSRRITETQNAYLTDGFGGLLVALVDKSDQHDSKVAASLVVFDETLQASQAAVRERDAYVSAGAHLPCPIPTTS